MCLRYSSSVVAPTARSSPRASIGLSRLAASTAPSAAPAPTIVCSSSMKRMTWPRASAISLSTAFRRSSNSPRYFEPATSAPMSSATTLRSRSDSGMSPETMRWARPSTMAVLPTPGSPISTGLFLVRRREDLDDAADLVVAADDRVELALLGGAREVAAEALERLVLLLGRLVGDAVRAADVGDRLEDLLAARAVGAQRLAGLGLDARRARAAGARWRCTRREQLASLGLGRAQDAEQLARGGRLGRRAGQRRERVQGGVDVGAHARRVDAELAQDREHDAVVLLEQGGEQVLGRRLRVAPARGERGGGRDGLLGLDREAVGLHQRCGTLRVSEILVRVTEIIAVRGPASRTSTFDDVVRDR